MPWLAQSRVYHCEPETGDEAAGWRGCRAMRSEAERASMGCPYVARPAPVTYRHPSMGGVEYPVAVPCPGHAMRRPVVVEVAAAYRAYDKGLLDSFWPDCPAMIWEGVMLLSRALNAHEAEELAKLKAKSNG